MKYVLTYSGGAGMPESEAEQQAIMAEWGAWFGVLGEALVDGGNPFGAARTISSNGVTDGGQLGGYSIISADSMDAAVAHAQGCPVLGGGGNVEVSEAIEM